MFDDYFEVFLADTEEGKLRHFNIRYQVYCEEMGFEKKANFSEQFEKDKWDNQSVHFMVRLKGTDQWVGAMRLILPGNTLLPIQEHCSLDSTIINEKRNHSAEVSRLCLVKEIRRRKTDGKPPIGIFEKDNYNQNKLIYYKDLRRLNHSIIWGLLRAASFYGKKHNLSQCYFLTTKALAKIITKENFKMYPIGPSCQLNGERFPYKMHLSEILSNPLWSQGYNASYKLYSQLKEPQLEKCA